MWLEGWQACIWKFNCTLYNLSTGFSIYLLLEMKISCYFEIVGNIKPMEFL